MFGFSRLSTLVRHGAVLSLALLSACTEETISALAVKEGRVASLALDPTWRPDTAIISEAYTFSPRVIARDENDKPIAGAKILIPNDSIGWREATTGSDGIARFGPITRRPLSLGTVSLVQAIPDPADRFNPFTETNVEVAVPVRGLRLQMTVESGNDQTMPIFTTSGTITVRVRDEFNRAASGVQIDREMPMPGQFIAPSLRTDTTGRYTLVWRPDEAFGLNRGRLSVSAAEGRWDLSNNPSVEVRVNQTLPTHATVTLSRADSVGTTPVTTGASGICRRFPIGVSVAALDGVNYTTPISRPVDKVPLTIRVQRPAGSPRCPGNGSDTVTVIRDTLDFAEIGIFGAPYYVPVTLGGGAGTNTIFVTAGNLPERSIAIVAARQPVITHSGTLQLPYGTRSTVPVTVNFRDTLGAPITNLGFSIFGNTGAPSTSQMFAYYGPQPLTSGSTGAFALNDFQANFFTDAAVDDPTFRNVTLQYLRTGATSGSSVIALYVVPTSINIPAGSTMVISNTPAATMLRNQLWRVNVTIAGPSNQLLRNIGVTRVLVSGPAGASVPPLTQYVMSTTSLLYDFIPTVAGTYTFEWRRAGFTTLTRSVTVQ